MFFQKKKEPEPVPELCCPHCAGSLGMTLEGYACRACNQPFTQSELLAACSETAKEHRQRRNNEAFAALHGDSLEKALQEERARAHKLESELRELRAEYDQLRMDELYADPVWANKRLDDVEDRLARLEGLCQSRTEAREYT